MIKDESRVRLHDGSRPVVGVIAAKILAADHRIARSRTLDGTLRLAGPSLELAVRAMHDRFMLAFSARGE